MKTPGNRRSHGQIFPTPQTQEEKGSLVLVPETLSQCGESPHPGPNHPNQANTTTKASPKVLSHHLKPSLLQEGKKECKNDGEEISKECKNDGEDISTESQNTLNCLVNSATPKDQCKRLMKLLPLAPDEQIPEDLFERTVLKDRVMQALPPDSVAAAFFDEEGYVVFRVTAHGKESLKVIWLTGESKGKVEDLPLQNITIIFTVDHIHTAYPKNFSLFDCLPKECENIPTVPEVLKITSNPRLTKKKEVLLQVLTTALKQMPLEMFELTGLPFCSSLQSWKANPSHKTNLKELHNWVTVELKESAKKMQVNMRASAECNLDAVLTLMIEIYHLIPRFPSSNYGPSPMTVQDEVKTRTASQIGGTHARTSSQVSVDDDHPRVGDPVNWPDLSEELIDRCTLENSHQITTRFPMLKNLSNKGVNPLLLLTQAHLQGDNDLFLKALSYTSYEFTNLKSKVDTLTNVVDKLTGDVHRLNKDLATRRKAVLNSTSSVKMPLMSKLKGNGKFKLHVFKTPGGGNCFYHATGAAILQSKDINIKAPNFSDEVQRKARMEVAKSALHLHSRKSESSEDEETKNNLFLELSNRPGWSDDITVIVSKIMNSNYEWGGFSEAFLLSKKSNVKFGIVNGEAKNKIVYSTLQPCPFKAYIKRENGHFELLGVKRSHGGPVQFVFQDEDQEAHDFFVNNVQNDPPNPLKTFLEGPPVDDVAFDFQAEKAISSMSKNCPEPDSGVVVEEHSNSISEVVQSVKEMLTDFKTAIAKSLSQDKKTRPSSKKSRKRNNMNKHKLRNNRKINAGDALSVSSEEDDSDSDVEDSEDEDVSHDNYSVVVFSKKDPRSVHKLLSKYKYFSKRCGAYIPQGKGKAKRLEYWTDNPRHRKWMISNCKQLNDLHSDVSVVKWLPPGKRRRKSPTRK